MTSPTERTASPFLLRRDVLPSSPRAALRELQPRIAQSRADLVTTLRAVARELEHEADQVSAGVLWPTHHLIGPYAAMLDKMRAEANLLREWTQVLSSEIVGPITPYMGSPVIPAAAPAAPSMPAAAAPAPGEPAAEARGSISALMDELASAQGM